MTLAFAKRCAATLVDLVHPWVDRVEVAGSVRRERPNCEDIDLVCIPKVQQLRDLLGNVISEDNLAARELQALGYMRGWKPIRNGAEITTIEARGCQVDFFWATPATFTSVLICRTGSKEHNIWAASRAKALGMKWVPNRGLESSDGTLLPLAYEEQFYAALGSKYLAPTERDGPFSE